MTSTRWPPPSPTAPASCWSARPTTRPARSSTPPSSTGSSPRCPTDVLVVVDEAYVEFVRDPDAAERPGRSPTTTTSSCSARSPRRTGWPGCGSATRSPTARSPRRSARPSPPFSVTDLAQAAAVASLDCGGRARRAGRGDRAPSAAACSPLCATRAGTCPRARPTSSGCRSATTRWTSRRVRPGLGAAVRRGRRTGQRRRPRRQRRFLDRVGRADWRSYDPVLGRPGRLEMWHRAAGYGGSRCDASHVLVRSPTSTTPVTASIGTFEPARQPRDRPIEGVA